MSRLRVAHPKGLAFTFWRRPNPFGKQWAAPAAHLPPGEGRGLGQQPQKNHYL